MSNTEPNNKVTALAALLKRIEDEQDLRSLCREARKLADEIDLTDIATAERIMVESGYSFQDAHRLMSLFTFMGAYNQKDKMADFCPR